MPAYETRTQHTNVASPWEFLQARRSSYCCAWKPCKCTLADGSEEGAVRLVSVVEVNGFTTGTLQVFCRGAWGSVCNSNFDDVDARVACRQLGFVDGIARLRDGTTSTPGPVCCLLKPCPVKHVPQGVQMGSVHEARVSQAAELPQCFSIQFSDSIYDYKTNFSMRLGLPTLLLVSSDRRNALRSCYCSHGSVRRVAQL